MLGGLRRYHAATGAADCARSPSAYACRSTAPTTSATASRGALISGPLSIEDPVDRVAAVRGEVLSLHTERALEVLDAAAPVMNRMPSFVGASALRTAVARRTPSC